MFLASNMKHVPRAAFPPQEGVQGVPQAVKKPLKGLTAAGWDCQILHRVMEHPTPQGEGADSESLLHSPPPQHAAFRAILRPPILG